MVTRLSDSDHADLDRLISEHGWGAWFLQKAAEFIPTFSRPTLVRLRTEGNAEKEYVAVAETILKTKEAKEQLSKLKKAKR